jgi:hypothetical protein
MCGLFEKGESAYHQSNYSHPLAQNDPGYLAAPYYVDSSSFMLGFSLSKDDSNTFAAGIDSSQAGSITLNLFFRDDDPGVALNRNIIVHIWGLCDAVFTIQNDANLVRW